LRRSFDATVTAFAAAVEARDPRTQEHLGRVSRLAAETARRMGLSDRQVEIVRYGAILHDIGKIAVPSEILAKKGPLTEDEMALLQAHAEIGAKMLEKTGLLEEAIPLVRYHEERWDGSVDGPFASTFGLSGEDIPLGARIIAVADTWDAMVSERPYRPTPGPSAAAAELRRLAGTQFDPEVVRVFLGLLGEEGLLSSGERAQAPLLS
jgi:putative nucleotidyltransferase with HDIG domain